MAALTFVMGLYIGFLCGTLIMCLLQLSHKYEDDDYEDYEETDYETAEEGDVVYER